MNGALRITAGQRDGGSDRSACEKPTRDTASLQYRSPRSDGPYAFAAVRPRGIGFRSAERYL